MRGYLEDLDAIAEALCKATVLPKEMQNPANLKLVLWQGLAMGFDIIQSIRASFIIPPKKDNEVPKVGYYADALVALVRSSPVCRFFRVEETTAKRCRIICARKDEPEEVIHVFELTIEDAREAGMDLVWFYPKGGGDLRSAVKQNWKSNQADMLNARNSTRACRRTFQDVVYGMRTPEDVEDFDGPELAAPQPEFVATPPRNAKPASVAPASSTPPSSAGAAPPAADVETVPDRPEVDEPEDEGTGDTAWDELVVGMSKLLKVDAGDLVLPGDMATAWNKAVAAAKDRRALNELAPAISEASKRTSRSKACGEFATNASKAFNDRNAALRKEQEKRQGENLTTNPNDRVTPTPAGKGGGK